MNSTAQLLRPLAVVELHWVYRIKGIQVPWISCDFIADESKGNSIGTARER